MNNSDNSKNLGSTNGLSSTPQFEGQPPSMTTVSPFPGQPAYRADAHGAQGQGGETVTAEPAANTDRHPLVNSIMNILRSDP